MFFPYKADVHLNKMPFITILVCLICIWVFYKQVQSENKFSNAVVNFCHHDIDKYTQQIIQDVYGDSSLNTCAKFFLGLRESKDYKQDIDRLVAKAKPLNVFQDIASEKTYMQEKFLEAHIIFERDVPNSLTDSLQYNPKDYQLWRMITSSFSHADLQHIFFNLLFFYMFAATLEVIVGPLVFLAAFLSLAVVTSVSYSWYVSGNLESLPSIGLSGVVFGVMTFLVVLAPHLRIKCLFWILFYWRVFRVNAVIFTAWYVLWNIYDLTHTQGSNVNYMAHVSGAAFGAVCGFFYRFKEQKRLREVVGF